MYREEASLVFFVFYLVIFTLTMEYLIMPLIWFLEVLIWIAPFDSWENAITGWQFWWQTEDVLLGTALVFAVLTTLNSLVSRNHRMLD